MRIPVIHWYFDGTTPLKETGIVLPDGSPATVFLKDTVNQYIQKIKRKEVFYYGNTDAWLYQALEKHPIYGKEVAIIGSLTPLYESIVLAYGGRPTTIEYNKILTDDNRLTVMTVSEFNQTPKKFDVVLSISSIEHDGLGRYGDPINPFADLEFMTMIKEKYLKKDGSLFLAVPVGKDCLCWNAHRIYGPIRLPMLLKNWSVVSSFGFSEENFNSPLGANAHQPVFYLTPKHE